MPKDSYLKHLFVPVGVLIILFGTERSTFGVFAVLCFLAAAGTNLNAVQRAARFAVTVVCTLINGAFNAVVCMAFIHNKTLLPK